MRIFILIVLCFFAKVLFGQESVSDSKLKERGLQIAEQVKYDLKDEIQHIEDLSIIGIPTCEMILDKHNNILFRLDTISGYAVLQSNGKTIDYAVKYNNTMSYVLRKINLDNTVYMGGSLLRLIDKEALTVSPNPFWIYTFSTKMFLGFGFFSDEKLQLIGFSGSKTVMFNNSEDFLSLRFESKKKYKKIVVKNSTSIPHQRTILFDKSKQDLRVQLLTGDDKKTKSYEVLIIKNGKTIVSDEVADHNSFMINSKYFFNAFEFLVQDEQILIFYHNYGQVFMDKYTFVADSVKTKKRYFIGNFGMMSYENGGDIKAKYQEVLIKNNLYFFIGARQLPENSLNKLVVIRNGEVSKISFSEITNLIVLKSVQVRKSQREWYENNKDLDNRTEADIEKCNLLSTYYNLPIGYYRMPTDDNTYAKESTFLWNNGLEEHKLIDIDISKNKELDNTQREQITNYIQHILSQYDDIEINKIDLLGYISWKNYPKYNSDEKPVRIKNFTKSFNGNIIYFFVEINSSVLKIVRYNLSTNDWLISDYTEEKVNIQ